MHKLPPKIVYRCFRKKFGRLLVLRVFYIGAKAWAECLCECGTVLDAKITSLLRLSKRSCGCLQRDVARYHGLRMVARKLFTGGAIVHGDNTRKYRTPEYIAWGNMMQRCYNAKFPQYDDYGGRGIRVCKRWRGPGGYKNFLEDMGRQSASDYSVDRINVDGNYEPANVRWATKKIQALNKRKANTWKNAIYIKYYANLRRTA